MIRLLRRWWRKVARWLGLTRSHTQPSDKAEVPSVEMKPLSDHAYETLYFSLLERQGDSTPSEAVAQEKAQIEGRVNDASFVDWLGRFGETLSANPTDNVALAQRMVALSSIELGELSRLSKEIGERLIAEASVSLVGPQTTNKSAVEDKVAEPEKAEASEPEKPAEFYFQQGNDACLRGDFEGAITAYDQALQIKPDDHVALHSKGVSLDKLRRYEEAIAIYDQALQIKPDFYEAPYGKGNCLAKLGRYEGAIAAYDQALQIKPDFHVALSNKKISLTHPRRYEETL